MNKNYSIKATFRGNQKDNKKKIISAPFNHPCSYEFGTYYGHALLSGLRIIYKSITKKVFVA